MSLSICKRGWIVAMAMIGLSCGVGSAQAERARQLGVGFDVSQDLPDGIHANEQASFGPAPGLQVPARLELGGGAWLRATVGANWAAGTDRVEWVDQGVRFYSDEHKAWLSSARVMAGPELTIWSNAARLGEGVRGRPVRVFAGPSVGVVWAQTWHSFADEQGESVTPLLDDLDGTGNLDPFSTQSAPLVELHGGLAFSSPSGLAIEAEVGYNLSFLEEVVLQQAPADLKAVRTGFGLNPLRVGVAATFHLKRGSKR